MCLLWCHQWHVHVKACFGNYQFLYWLNNFLRISETNTNWPRYAVKGDKLHQKWVWRLFLIFKFSPNTVAPRVKSLMKTSLTLVGCQRKTFRLFVKLSTLRFEAAALSSVSFWSDHHLCGGVGGEALSDSYWWKKASLRCSQPPVNTRYL